MILQDETPALQVENLRVYYWTSRGPVKAVDDVSFTIQRNERFGFIGESGCGKTTTIMAILRLIKKPGKIESGRILLNGRDIVAINKEEMRQTRWSKISLIPQGAMNSLNPIMRVRDQIGDTILTHKGTIPSAVLRAEIHALLDMVELPAKVADMYPHELSGGMKQRVCIAMGISLQPAVILADEPTSALDVVVQRQVMETLGKAQEAIGAALILVGHDMGLMAQFVHKIGVMYAGKLVEVGPVNDMFEEPLHPYTQLLIASLPSLEGKGVFKGIPGITPSLLNPPTGCAFHPRCPKAMSYCSTKAPVLQEVRPGRWVSCHLYE